MKYWLQSGVFELDDVPKGERASVYSCLAQRLADVISNASPLAP